MMRLIWVTESISHFEVPLFRLVASMPGLDFTLLYQKDIGGGKAYDESYQQNLDWGISLTQGYQSHRVESPDKLADMLDQIRPEAMMLYGYRGPFLGRALVYGLEHGIPLGLRATANYQLDRRNPWKSLLRPLALPIFRLFRAVHYGGRASYRYFRLMGVPKHRLFFVPYSVHTPYFLRAPELFSQARAEVRKQLGFPPEAFVVLFVGQLSWFKGPDMALHVFRHLHARLPRARFLVVGDGVMRRELEGEAGALLPPGTVKFVGFQNQKEIPAYYLAADVALFTTRYETWARAVNECMACGLPCVVSNRLPASMDLVQDGVNGYVIPYGQWQTFIGRLLQLAQDPDLRSRLGKAATEECKLFSYAHHIKTLKNSFNSFLNIDGADLDNKLALFLITILAR